MSFPVSFGEGDCIQVTGQLYRPQRARNPGAFDWAALLEARGIMAVADCTNVCLARRENSESGNHDQGAFDWWLLFRSRLRGDFLESLPPRHRGLVDALIFGWRTEIPPEIRRAFQHTGTAHLLAISGLHVGLLVCGICLVMRVLHLSDGPSHGLLILLLLVYLGLVRSSAPVQRAVVLAVVWAAGRPFYRSSSVVNRLAFAGCGLLWLDRNAWQQPGTCLSFLAVAAIVWSGCDRTSLTDDADPIRVTELIGISLWRRAIHGLHRWFRITLWPMAAIWIVTTPLVAASFRIVSISGLWANLLAIPLLACSLMILFVQLVCASVCGPINVLGFLSCALLDLFVGWIQWCEGYDGGWVITSGPAVASVFAFYVTFLAAVWLDAVVGRPKGRILLLTIFSLGLIHDLAGQSRRADGLKVTWLDVGHGAAVVLEFPNGSTMLYDVGSLRSPERSARVVGEFLTARNIRCIDAVVISHSDSDHCNGLGALLDRVRIGCVVMSRQTAARRQPILRDALRAMERARVPLVTVAAGDRLVLDSSCPIELLHPDAAFIAGTDNELSMVLKVASEDSHVLLTGDLEGAGLNRLISSGRMPARGTVDVLQVPHHGSLSAAPEVWARRIRPCVAIVSCGHTVRSEELKRRFASNCQLYFTSRSGAVVTELSKGGLTDCDVTVQGNSWKDR